MDRARLLGAVANFLRQGGRVSTTGLFRRRLTGSAALERIALARKPIELSRAVRRTRMQRHHIGADGRFARQPLRAAGPIALELPGFEERIERMRAATTADLAAALDAWGY